MKPQEPTRKSIDLGRVTTQRLARIARGASRRAGTPASRPTIGVNITVRFTESSPAATGAFARAVAEASRRCGPRHTEDARREGEVTEAEVAGFAEELEPEIMRFVASSPEAAALYAFDPVRALKLLDKPPRAELLSALMATGERAGGDARMLRNVPIGTINVEMEEKRMRTPGRRIGSTGSGEGDEPR